MKYCFSCFQQYSDSILFCTIIPDVADNIIRFFLFSASLQNGERSDEGPHSGQVMLFPGRSLNCNLQIGRNPSLPFLLFDRRADFCYPLTDFITVFQKHTPGRQQTAPLRTFCSSGRNTETEPPDRTARRRIHGTP